MYDSFDNTYQATIGIDFLSKVHTASPFPLPVGGKSPPFVILHSTLCDCVAELN